MTIKFSFIIPCFNEEKFIERCLRSINHQDYPRTRYETILVDNGSNDRSLDIATEFADKVVSAANVTIGAVRNIGASEAVGDILIFIDADCTIDSGWLSRAENLYFKNPNTIFGGGADLPDNAGWIEKSWLLEGDNGVTMPKELIGCSIMISKENFEFVNGFKPDLASGEDSDLSIRLRRTGKDIRINRELNVTHHGNAKTLSSFIKRQVWHSRSYRKNLKHNIYDPIFILTIIFTLTSTLSLALLITNKITESLFFLFITAIIPGILTIKRFRRANYRPRTIKAVTLAYILDTLYVASRAFGILKSRFNFK